MKTIGIPLTGSKHLAHDIALQSGHTNFLFLGSAMNPEEHYHKKTHNNNNGINEISRKKNHLVAPFEIGIFH